MSIDFDLLVFDLLALKKIKIDQHFFHEIVRSKYVRSKFVSCNLKYALQPKHVYNMPNFKLQVCFSVRHVFVN